MSTRNRAKADALYDGHDLARSPAATSSSTLLSRYVSNAARASIARVLANGFFAASIPLHDRLDTVEQHLLAAAASR